MSVSATVIPTRRRAVDSSSPISDKSNVLKRSCTECRTREPKINKTAAAAAPNATSPRACKRAFLTASQVTKAAATGNARNTARAKLMNAPRIVIENPHKYKRRRDFWSNKYPARHIRAQEEVYIP